VSELVHELIRIQARRAGDTPALRHKAQSLTYGELWELVDATARGFTAAGLGAGERVAVFLPKRIEAVAGLFGAAAAGGVFVPVNPLLKPRQVGYILRDCNVRALVTSIDRAQLLADELEQCHDLRTLVLVEARDPLPPGPSHTLTQGWDQLIASGGKGPGLHRRIDRDMAAILYTSGSTGQPKGVVLSHRNLVAGATSVAQYLENRPEDRLLAVLPLSFDYGLSQLTTAFRVGASVALMDYLLPRDVIRAVADYRITGLAAVPPLWSQLAGLEWPETTRNLRYVTNSGGAMPRAVTDALRKALPETRIYLMYGLTEAFRSTYLPPELVDRHPDSMGRAIPNAEILVVREDGSPCAPGEPGELVHRGALVTMGYWNDPKRTAERFRAAPGRPAELSNPEIAVWSGDQVRQDEDGLLYFVARKDEMIKTSGYRVSPTEVEEVIYASTLVAEVVALGIPHSTLGQAILVVAVAHPERSVTEEQLILHCKRELPNFMVPERILLRRELPRNPNGKIDRRSLAQELQAIDR
jgi:acyl-CoA ligase (AMP-forming) (exosortase A-associated)